jgi:hypothetical protein
VPAKVPQVLALLLVLRAVGCMSDGSRNEARPSSRTGGSVLYSIGVSSDPYGRSSPAGFGVLGNPADDPSRPVEVRRLGLSAYSGATWLDGERVLVPRRPPPFLRPLIYHYRAGDLTLLGPSPLPALEAAQHWSPDGRLVASERIAPCKPKQRTLFECYRHPGNVYVRQADGSDRRLVHRGHFNDWMPDGRLLVIGRSYNGPYEALDVASGRRSVPLSPARVARAAGAKNVVLGPPRWSADRRYLAAQVAVRRAPDAEHLNYIVIAEASGLPVRFLESEYVVSMFAWSPRGHRLAYTTSGFPDPHELYVVDGPRAKPRLLFETADRHFDWVTWSPDAAWLLLDDEHAQRWRLLAVDGGSRRALPRFGGKPLWCCPVNSYATLNG